MTVLRGYFSSQKGMDVLDLPAKLGLGLCGGFYQ